MIPGEVSDDRGMFSPFAVAEAATAAGIPAEVKFYTHDITCQPNKTYKYAMRYYLRNPYFQASEKVKAELKQPYYIESPMSAFSKEITVPARVEIYAVKIDPKKPDPAIIVDSAEFDVFVSREGAWQKEHVRVGVGEPIAGRGPDGKEWNSGWALVDVRRNPRSPQTAYLVIADANGKLEKRDPALDTVNQDYQQKNAIPGAVPGGVAPPLQPTNVPPPPGGFNPPVRPGIRTPGAS